MSREIPLSKGFVTIVDTKDFDRISKFKWHYLKTGYASRTQHHHMDENGKRVRSHILMHRFIMGITDKSQIVDHINGNPLDNRKCNLRVCNKSENSQNARKKAGNRNFTSLYKGVSKVSPDKWVVLIKPSKLEKSKYIGTYYSEIAAAKGYNAAALKYHGKFAYLNDIPV